MSKLEICNKALDNAPSIPAEVLLGGIAVDKSDSKPTIDIKQMQLDREKHFVDLESLEQLAVGCGDERCVCEGSMNGLESEEGNLEHFIRCYGGPFGLAHTLILNRQGVIPPNNAGLRDSLSSHKSAVELVIKRLDSAGIVPILHSDNSSEEGESFNPDNNAPDVGCAFAKKLGLITNLMHREYVIGATEKLIHDQGGDTSMITSMMASKQQMIESGIDENFHYDRSDYRDLVDNVAVLDGAHAPAEDTALVMNYKERVSRPAPGLEAFYDVDVLIVAKTLVKLFPEINFNPEELLASIELQSVTTAHALALGTRKEGSNLEMLAIELYGNRQDALEELKQYIAEKSSSLAVVA